MPQHAWTARTRSSLLAALNKLHLSPYMYISLNRNDFLLSFQVDCMWGGDATLCRGQHIPQVPHHHQVLPENVEQCQRDTNLHLSGCGDGWRQTRLELDLRHRHCHSVSGCPGHRLAPLQYFTNKCHGIKGKQLEFLGGSFLKDLFDNVICFLW